MQQQPKPQHGGTREGAGRKPSYGEPTKTIRVPQSQVSVVVDYLDGLKHRSGIAESTVLQPRSIAPSRAVTSIPNLGRRVRAGKPTSGDDYQEEPVDIGRHLVRDPKSTFLMKVVGWSMRDAGIADGDELIVDRAVASEAGRIVIAEVDGELTVKRLQRTSTGWLLEAASPDFSNLVIDAGKELNIWGVVTRVVRKL